MKMSNLVDKATMLQVITCLDSLLDRANHDEYLTRIGKKEALKFLEENEKYANIIKSSLQRLEAIDNAKPSEAMKCLEEIRRYFLFPKSEEYPIIKQALLKSQEQEKVLEIIKKKTISIFQLSCCKDAYAYNDLKFKNSEKITQEEFDLLKRYFK